ERPFREMRGQPGLLSDDACRHTACAEDQSSEYVVLLSTVRAGLWRHTVRTRLGFGEIFRPTFLGKMLRIMISAGTIFGGRGKSHDGFPVRYQRHVSGGVKSNGFLFDCLGYFNGSVGPKISRLEDADFRREVTRLRMDVNALGVVFHTWLYLKRAEVKSRTSVEAAR